MKYRHLGLSVGGTFFALIFILIGVGWVGLNRMAKTNAQIRSMVDANWPEVELASEALRISNLNNRITMQLFLTTDRKEISDALARRAANSARITEIIHQLEMRIDSTKESELLARVKQTRAAYVESYKLNTHVLIDLGDPARAKEAMVKETFPRLLEYHAAWSEYLHVQGDEMDEAARRSAAEYAAARSLMLVLTSLAVACAVVLAVFTTRQLVVETSRRETAENETRRLNQDLEQKVSDRTAELMRSNGDLLQARDALRFEAAHDPLTRLWNHGAILEFLQKELDRQKRTNDCLGVMMADLDHFKDINDTHGHMVGDEVLQEAARRLQRAMRSYDFIGRYGGEEFLVLVPGCEGADLMAAAQRLCRVMAEKPVASSVGAVSITVSIGVASTAPPSRDVPFERLLQAADAALYAAKAEGRNRVAPEPPGRMPQIGS